MITPLRQAPLGRAVVRLCRALATARRGNRLLHDPVFLPDFAIQMPDQVQELRRGRGRVR